MYVVTHPQADALAAALADRGIGARGYYRIPVHRQPAMTSYRAAPGGLRSTEVLAQTNLALPMNPFLSSTQAEEVVDAIDRATQSIGQAARVR
jgi:dTDP-3-amino-3,4,6-trideoxy-alpha-D-glucose transaminase